MSNSRRGGYSVAKVIELAKECELLTKSAELAKLKAENIVNSLLWSDIETAPKRGEYISVCIGEHNFDPYRVYFPETVKWENEKWVDKKGVPIDYEPTHWIKLPQAPLR